VNEALASGAIAPFGTTEGALGRLETSTEEQGEKYAGILRELKAKGITGPHAEEIADALLSRAEQVRPHTMNEAVPKTYEDLAMQVIDKPDKSGLLDLDQAENLKRSVQGMAKYGRYEETPKNEAMRDAATIFRQAVEEQVQRVGDTTSNPEVKQLAQDFVPTKQRLGRLIEARNAAERGASRGATRGNFGMPEWLEMATELAAGHPGAAIGVPVATRLIRGRLPSAGAAGIYRLATALNSPATERAIGLTASAPGTASPAIERLRNVFAPKPAFADSDWEDVPIR
jgi:hypothetical protein